MQVDDVFVIRQQQQQQQQRRVSDNLTDGVCALLYASWLDSAAVAVAVAASSSSSSSGSSSSSRYGPRTYVHQARFAPSRRELGASAKNVMFFVIFTPPRLHSHARPLLCVHAKHYLRRWFYALQDALCYCVCDDVNVAPVVEAGSSCCEQFYLQQTPALLSWMIWFSYCFSAWSLESGASMNLDQWLAMSDTRAKKWYHACRQAR